LQVILDKLIEESSKPLSVIEQDFATDMTGIRTTLFTSWFSLRAKKTIVWRDHLRDHLTTGIKSMIVPAIDIKMGEGEDGIIMREHVDKVNENFMINNWLGDTKYWSKDNCEKVGDIGGKPYFKGKKGKTAWNGQMGGSLPWKKMNEEARDHPRRFKRNYRFRVKAECTIHSKKSIHGNKVYSRLASARKNEETLRWINHNINVLNRARCEWNINPLGN